MFKREENEGKKLKLKRNRKKNITKYMGVVNFRCVPEIQPAASRLIYIYHTLSHLLIVHDQSIDSES